jgi:hypothetical protein
MESAPKGYETSDDSQYQPNPIYHSPHLLHKICSRAYHLFENMSTRTKENQHPALSMLRNGVVLHRLVCGCNNFVCRLPDGHRWSVPGNNVLNSVVDCSGFVLLCCC